MNYLALFSSNASYLYDFSLGEIIMIIFYIFAA